MRWALLPAVVALAVAVGLSLLLVSGLRLFVVESASMGTTAPVGSLVVVRAEPAYAVGDVITFDMRDTTMTHRVVGSDEEGLRTRGDLNGADDPGRRQPESIIGRAAVIIPVAGFGLTALPWALLGAALVEALARLARRRSAWSRSVRLLGGAVVVSAATAWTHPWFDAQLVDVRAASGTLGAVMHVVNTGILPISVGGVRLSQGQDATITATDTTSSGAYTIAATPAPEAWQVAVGVGLCLVPLIAAVLLRPAARRGGHPSRYRAFASATVAVVVVLAATPPATPAPTDASFTASLTDPENGAGTNTEFTCRSAIAHSAPDLYAGYALDTAGALTAPDLSPNARTGVLQEPATTTPVAGCRADASAATVFDGVSQCVYVPGRVTAPNTFSLEAWFRTTHASNGRILGFGSTPDATTESAHDRVVYLDPAGRVVFGVYPRIVVAVASPDGRTYADGEWHAVIATLSDAGLALYVDGELVASNADYTTGEESTGYWKVGCGSMTYWSNGGGVGDSSYSGPSFFTGDIQFAAIYTRALSAEEARGHYLSGLG